MNLPNKLTVIRAILIIPFCIVTLTGCAGEASNWISLVIFCVASITDFLDGMIARKNNLVTNFGKFMDPIADKLLVCSAFICLMNKGVIPAWVVIVVISREFVVSGFRLIASDNGVVIAASYFGKFKTVSQMAMIIMMLSEIEILKLPAVIVMYIAVVLTVVSLVDYVYKNRKILSDD